MALHLPTIPLSSSNQQSLARNSSLDRFRTPNRFSTYVQPMLQPYPDPSTPMRSALINVPLSQNVGNFDPGTPFNYPREQIRNSTLIQSMPNPNWQESMAMAQNQYNFLQARRNVAQQQMSLGGGDLSPGGSRLIRVSNLQESTPYSRSYSPSVRNTMILEQLPERPLLPKIESTFKKAANQALKDTGEVVYETRTERKPTKIYGSPNSEPDSRTEMLQHLEKLQKKQSMIYQFNDGEIPQRSHERNLSEKNTPVRSSMKMKGKHQSQGEIIQTPARLDKQNTKIHDILADIDQNFEEEKVRKDNKKIVPKIQFTNEEDEDEDSEDSEREPTPKPQQKVLLKSGTTPNLHANSPRVTASDEIKSALMKKPSVQLGGNFERTSKVRATTILSNLAWKRLQRGGTFGDQYEEEKVEGGNNQEEDKIEEVEEEEKPKPPKLKLIEEEKPIIKQPKKKETKRSSANKKKSQARIKALMWMAFSFKFMCEDRKKSAYEKRDMIEENITMKIAPTYEALRNFIIKVAGKEILALLMNKQFSLVFVSTKVLPEKKLDKDCAALKEQLKVIFDCIVKNISSLPSTFFKFLGDLSEENCFLPSNYFTEFEINRLPFGYFGTLRHMDSEKSKLIIGGITLVRVFIHMVIMQPWDAFSMTKDKFNPEKLINVGSVMYNVAMELFRVTAPLIENSHKIYSLELKTHPKKKLLNAFADQNMAKDFLTRKDNSRDGEIITGFYSKQQLSCFFSERKRIVQELKEMMQEWLDGFYDATHKEWEKKNNKKK